METRIIIHWICAVFAGGDMENVKTMLIECELLFEKEA